MSKAGKGPKLLQNRNTTGLYFGVAGNEVYMLQSFIDIGIAFHYFDDHTFAILFCLGRISGPGIGIVHTGLVKGIFVVLCPPTLTR